MKKLTILLLAAILAGAFCTATSLAEEKKEAGAGGNLSAADKSFLMNAEQINLAEIKQGELAQEKGGPKAKEFGAKLISDHKKVSADLKSLAESKGVMLPTEPDAKHKEKAEALGKLEGDKFDAAFFSANEKGHKKAISLYEKGAKSSDAEIKAFAEKTLPGLHDHEKMATDGTEKMGASAEKNKKAKKE
jgi:putative membrane protein